MKLRIKKLTLAAAITMALIMPSMVFAQVGSSDYKGSNIGLGFRIGVGAIDIVGDYPVELQQGLAYGFDLAYVGDIGSNFGFSVGLSLVRLSSGVDIGNVQTEFLGPLPVDMGFGNNTSIWRAHYVGLTSAISENYDVTLIEVPVKFHYSFNNFFIGVGPKFAIPLSLHANYTTGITTLAMDVVVSNDITPINSVEQDPIDAVEGRYKLYGSNGKLQSVAVMATAEFGYRLAFNNNNSLMISVYGDYNLGSMSLNNVKSDPLLLLGVDNMEYRGLLNTGSVNGLQYFKYGIKVQYNFGFKLGARAPKEKKRRPLDIL